jgi:hypothetical protein
MADRLGADQATRTSDDGCGHTILSLHERANGV